MASHELGRLNLLYLTCITPKFLTYITIPPAPLQALDVQQQFTGPSVGFQIWGCSDGNRSHSSFPVLFSTPPPKKKFWGRGGGLKPSQTPSIDASGLVSHLEKKSRGECAFV